MANPKVTSQDVADSIDRTIPYAEFSDSQTEFAYQGLIRCGECGAVINNPTLSSHALLTGPKRYVWYYKCPLASGFNNCNKAKEIALLLEERIDTAVVEQIIKVPHYADALYAAFLEPWDEAEEALYKERMLLTTRQFHLTRKLAQFNHSHLANSLGKRYRAQLAIITERLKEIPYERQTITREQFDGICDHLLALVRKRALPTQWRTAVLRPLVKKVVLHNDRFELTFTTRTSGLKKVKEELPSG